MRDLGRVLLCAASLLAAIACADVEGAARASARSAPPLRVDTVFTPEEEMRRFTADIVERPERLSNGHGSIDALAGAFVRSLAAGDTAKLHALRLSRAEFAFLYFETTPVSRPPYALSPGLLWFQMDSRSTRGATRLLEEFSEAQLRYRGVRCSGPVQVQGRNRIHPGCAVTFEHPAGGVRTGEFFGRVVERDGYFKILAYPTGE